MGVFSSVRNFINKLNPFSKKDGQKVVKELLKNPISLAKEIRDGNIVDGSIIYFEYDAKDQNAVFDMKPLIIVFGISRGYILGLNFHWIPMKSRKELVEFIIKLNIKNKKIQTPLTFTYKDFKPLLKNIAFRRAVRLYIRKRTSLNGIIIDPKYLLDVVQLRLEHFSE